MDHLIFILSLSMFLEPFAYRHESGLVRGRISNATDGAPIAGALAVVGEDQYGALSDEDGCFAIERIPPGEYCFRVRYRGFTPWILYHLTVSRDTAVMLDVALSDPRTLLGGATPPAGPRVLFYHPDDRNGPR